MQQSCGGKLDEARAVRDADGRAKLHADIAQPINSACREIVQSAVIKAFREEKERAKQPGYRCTYDDFDGDYEGSYTAVVGELNHRTNGNYRSHGAHAPRGVHEGNGATVGRREEKHSDNFGAGVF